MMTILQDQASGERSQDQWSCGSYIGQHMGYVPYGQHLMNSLLDLDYF